MRSLQSRDRLTVTEREDPDSYTAERRWILGSRLQPVSPVEKVMRLPKNTTHFVQNGPYSITVNDYKNLFLQVTRTSGNKAEEINLESNVEIIIPSPAEGYFLVSLSNQPLRLIEPDGRQRRFPQNTFQLTTTSFEWIDNRDSLLLLAGTMFGHIDCFTITRSNIVDNQFIIDEHKAPISSLAYLEYHGEKFILVGTFFDLIILKWSDYTKNPEHYKTIERISEKKICIPSFVITNQKYIAWLTNEDLRVFTPEQLLHSDNECKRMPFEHLKHIIQIEPQIFLSQLNRPCVMSKHHVILAAPSVVVGFDLKTLETAFRFPFTNTITSMFLTPNLLSIVTTSHLYKIDLADEREISPIVLVSDVKNQIIQKKQTSEGVTLAELLSALLENNDFKGAIQTLHNALANIPLPKVDDNENVPLSEEAVEEICIEFLLYELNVITLCNKDEKVDLKPSRVINTNGKYDMLASLAHLLRLREFSRAGDKIRDESVITSLGRTETAVAMLLEKAYSQSEHDAHILSALNSALLIHPDEQQYLVESISAKKREEATSILENNSAAFSEAILCFLKPSTPKDVADKVTSFISEDRKRDIIKLLTQKGLDDKQKDTIVNALDILIEIAEKEKLPSVIMRYREIVEDHCKSKDINDMKVLSVLNFSMPYLPGQLSTNMCLAIIKEIATSKNKFSSIDIALWNLALANDEPAAKKDEELHKMIKDVTLEFHINNVPETFEHLIRRGLYISAADVALQAKMYSKAVYAVSCYPHEAENNRREILIRRYIRMTPRSMWQDLCKKYNVSHIDEEEKDGEGPSQARLVEKFKDLRQKIKDLRNKAAESADFLEQINNWGDVLPQASERCAECGKQIGTEQAYAFSCGHTFHASCMKAAAFDTLSVSNQNKLLSFKSSKLTPEERKIVEDILLDDCPKCGLASVNLIRIPIVTKSRWGLE